MNQKDDNLKKNTLLGLAWTFMERIGTQVVSFIVSIVLARLLLPEQYGVIAFITIIINLLDIFVTSGFSSALIQKKDADEIDFSSVLFFNIAFSAVLYVILFFSAPLIAKLTDFDNLVLIIRVMGIGILFSAVSSVIHALLTRKMLFKKFFWASFGGTAASAVVGITLAVKLEPEFGVWALVAQYLTNIVIDAIILFIVAKWIPKLKFSFKRLKQLLSYGWKVLVSNFINAVFLDIRTFVIGIGYSASDLAFYNKGRQFPNLAVSNINSTIQSVLFPVLSKKQDDKSEIKRIMRRAIKTSAYVILPVVFGLASVADPLVRVALGEKWLECVPYLQIACATFSLQPLQTANLQAIYALGRSDIALKLEVIKRTFSLIAVIVSCFFGVKAIAIAGVVITLFSFIVNVFPNRKLFNYGYLEQIKDILPFVLMSAVMAGAVIGIGFIPINIYLKLVIQVLSGVIIYVALSMIFKVESFRYILNIIKPFFAKIISKFKKTKNSD